MVDTEPKRTKPESRSIWAGPSAWTPILWPSRMFSLSAVDSSTTTSPGPGQEPSTSVSGLKRDVPEAMLKPRLGAPPYTIALPSLPISCAWPSTLPSAASTSGSLRTVLRSDSFSVGAEEPTS